MTIKYIFNDRSSTVHGVRFIIVLWFPFRRKILTTRRRGHYDIVPPTPHMLHKYPLPLTTSTFEVTVDDDSVTSILSCSVSRTELETKTCTTQTLQTICRVTFTTLYTPTSKPSLDPSFICKPFHPNRIPVITLGTQTYFSDSLTYV